MTRTSFGLVLAMIFLLCDCSQGLSGGYFIFRYFGSTDGPTTVAWYVARGGDGGVIKCADKLNSVIVVMSPAIFRLLETYVSKHNTGLVDPDYHNAFRISWVGLNREEIVYYIPRRRWGPYFDGLCGYLSSHGAPVDQVEALRKCASEKSLSDD
jgi:hypothetical protein